MKKEQLIAALECVKPGLANRELIEQSTSFAFISGTVCTYNDEISISCPVEGLEIEGAIQATELYAILKKLKQDEIDITMNSNEVILKAGKVTCGLKLQQQITLPLSEIEKPKRWKALPEVFEKAMRMAMLSSGTDNSDPILTCVCISPTHIIGTDGFKLYKTILEEPFVKSDVLIPATSVATILNFNPTEIATGSGWVLFRKANGAVLSCRTFIDKYPNTDKIVNVEGVDLKFPRTIALILERANVFGKHGASITDEEVLVEIADKRIKFTANSESGWSKEEANINYDGEPLTFKIMPSLLKGILSESLNCIFSKRMLKFSGDNWLFITMLKA